jgi:carbon-monoxide dehydrogenase medium subunit
MKPAKFEYHTPATTEEAIDLLQRYGGEAKILAGGQSLVPLMNFRLSRPAALIDINRIGALAYVEEDGSRLRLGAMTRQRAIEHSALVRSRVPLLTDATALVGHLPIRTRGTIGGSLAHADPAAEYPAVVTALEGELVARGPRGQRTIRAEEFFVAYLTTSLAPDEILTEVRLPIPPPGAGWAFEEFSRRHGDFAIVGIAALLVAEGGRCTKARLATAGVGPVPVRLRGAEEILERDGLEERSFKEAGARAAEQVSPDGDLHASADYRRHLTNVLTVQALRKAAGRIGGRHG